MPFGIDFYRFVIFLRASEYDFTEQKKRINSGSWFSGELIFADNLPLKIFKSVSDYTESSRNNVPIVTFL